MQKKIFEIYKIPLLLSLTLAIALIAFRLDRDVLDIALVFLGSFAGAFFLDLDYFMYAFFMEPKAEFSKNFATFTKHWDIPNALKYAHYHKADIKEKTLNSALFQIVLAALAVFVSFSSANVFAKTLVLSALLNSIYQFSEYYFENKLDEWFWSFKQKPNKDAALSYIAVIGLVFIFCLINA